MATGELREVKKNQKRWGDSCILVAQDNALFAEGVNVGDYLVVKRSDAIPKQDGLVVIQRQANTAAPKAGNKQGQDESKLLLRKLEHYGDKIRMQLGSSPRNTFFLFPREVDIWGTVVAVMRKFEAA